MAIKNQHQLELTYLWLERFKSETQRLKNSDKKHELGTKLLIISYEEQTREFLKEIEDYKKSLEKTEQKSYWRKIISKFK